MQKILEFKNLDWMKGISTQPNAPIGGLFQTLQNVDPFEQGGLALPSLAPASQSIGTIAKFLTNWNNGGTGMLYAHSNSKLYQVLKDSPYTVTDETSQINQSFAIGGTTMVSINGAKIWKNRYIYACVDDANNGYIRANTLPVNSGNDVTLVKGFIANLDYIPMEIGADGNLYFGDEGRIGECTNVTGTTNGTSSSGNGTTFNIDDGFEVRKLVNDGRYLVIVADNNARNVGDRVPGDYLCKVYFWDMVTTDGSGRIVADAVWTIHDSYMIDAEFLEGVTYLIGANGLYVTNVATPPKLIPIPASFGMPLTPSQVVVSKGSILWADGIGSVINNIYAYGNPTTGLKKIFYQPYTTNVGGSVCTALAAAGNEFILANGLPELYFFNVGATRQSMSIETINNTMLTTFTYEFTKIVLAEPLASGQTVTVFAFSQNGSQIITQETQSYNSAKPKQTLLFRRQPTAASSNQPEKFEDINILITTTGGAAVQRFAVYATPIDDANNDL